MRRLAIILSVIVMLVTSAESAQDRYAPGTEEQARTIIATAATEAKNDSDQFTRTFMRAVGDIRPESKHWLTPFLSLSQQTGESFSVYIVGPLQTLFVLSSECVRLREPLEKCHKWSEAVDVRIGVSRVDAPNIIRVLVERADKIVEPIASTLTPKEYTTRMGAKATLNTGTVSFPLSAFEPGAPVVVTVMPETGRNVVKRLTDPDLRRIW